MYDNVIKVARLLPQFQVLELDEEVTIMSENGHEYLPTTRELHQLLMLAVLKKNRDDFKAFPDGRVLFHGEFYSWDELPLAIINAAAKEVEG